MNSGGLKMSIRAYKVTEIKFEPESFNVSHNYDLLSMIGFTDTLNEDCAGLVTVFKNKAEIHTMIGELQERIKDTNRHNEISSQCSEAISEAITVLKTILEDMGENDYVQYWCF